MNKEEIEDRINNYSYSLVSEAHTRCNELNEIEHIWITSLINGIWYVHKKGEFDPINNYIQKEYVENNLHCLLRPQSMRGLMLHSHIPYSHIPWDPIKELEAGHKKQMKNRICTSKEVQEVYDRLYLEKDRYGSIYKPDQFQYIYDRIHYEYFKLLQSLEYLHSQLKSFEEREDE